ncbi:DUF6153 family protein [Streptomyces sp. NPDC048290]|uniref:DUF6153 family protein n=1 Tax=Streptomyces sp. NPDC048290 TaxID=3155811 RepID=UPI00342729A9
MTSTAQRARRRPPGRAALLLVFTVLAGVLAMHGLGPGGAPAPHSAHGTTTTSAMAAHGDTPSIAPALSAPHEVHCVRAAPGDGTSGHLRHADMTCAASGVSTSYATPALLPAVERMAAPGPAPGLPAATDSGRAPPDLAELQLLRI